MARFMCLQCGVQFAESELPPDHCPICEDERQYVRWEGQAWTTYEDLAKTHRLAMKDDAGVLAFGALMACVLTAIWKILGKL